MVHTQVGRGPQWAFRGPQEELAGKSPCTVSRNLGGKCTLWVGLAENQDGGPTLPRWGEGWELRLGETLGGILAWVTLAVSPSLSPSLSFSLRRTPAMPGCGVCGWRGSAGAFWRGGSRPGRDTQQAAFTSLHFLLGPPEWVAWWGGGP